MFYSWDPQLFDKTSSRHPFSPFSRMAQSALELTNTPYEMQCVDLFANEHKEDWFEKLNKKKQVPVLVDGDFVITESSVIMKYICNKIGDTSLYPSDPKLRNGTKMVVSVDVKY